MTTNQAPTTETFSTRTARTPRKLLGFQIADLMGENIQGEDDDPSGHPSFYVMDMVEASAVLQAHDNRNLLLMPIYEGDIENPAFAAG